MSRVKFVSISGVPREDGGETFVAVDRIGQCWRCDCLPGEKPADAKWVKMPLPILPDSDPTRRFRD